MQNQTIRKKTHSAQVETGYFSVMPEISKLTAGIDNISLSASDIREIKMFSRILLDHPDACISADRAVQIALYHILKMKIPEEIPSALGIHLTHKERILYYQISMEMGIDSRSVRIEKVVADILRKKGYTDVAFKEFYEKVRGIKRKGQFPDSIRGVVCATYFAGIECGLDMRQRFLAQFLGAKYKDFQSTIHLMRKRL